jgi:hypothetical protein
MPYSSVCTAAFAFSGASAYAERLLHVQGVIKLTNAAIQKHPNELVFKSLKAVALQRTGKSDEAMQVGQPACRSDPAMYHCSSS